MNSQANLEEFDASDQLKQLVTFALNHGIELLQKQGSFLPMVIAIIKGNYDVTVITAPSKTPDILAKRHVAGLSRSTEAYAAIFEGKIQVGDEYIDAVLVFAGERGKAYGYRLSQTYQRNWLRQVKPIGKPGYGGRHEQFLTP